MSAVPDMEDRAAVHADVRRMQAWCAPLNGRVARAYECVSYCEDALRELGGPTGNWQGAMLSQINKNAWAKCRRFYMQVAGAAEIEQRANAEVAQQTRGSISAAEIAADQLARRGLAGAQPLAAQESYNLYWVKDIRGRNVTLAAVHRARDEEPLVALVPLAGGRPNEFRYDPSVLAEFKRVILPFVKARAPLAQKVDLANYVRAFHRLNEPGGEELPLMNLSFAPDIFAGGAIGSGEWNHHPNRGGPADPQVVIGNGYDQNTIAAARVADQQMAVAEAIRDAQVANELAQRGPRPPNHPLADFIDRMGMGTVARDVFALADRDHRASIDSSGVTYVEGVRTVVKVCNDGDRRARVASVRADCPASMLFDQSLKCVLNLSGWSHLEPKQCKPW